MTAAVQIHGSMPFEELRHLSIDPSLILDFSATVNPYPLPRSIVHLFTGDGIAAYPDPQSHGAATAIAAHYGLPTEWVVIAAGLTEIIFILPLIHDRAALFFPTYGDYRAAYARHRRSMEAIAFPETDQEFDMVVGSLRNTPFDLLVICNPNNPDGKYCTVRHIVRLCETFTRASICIDESYQEMSDCCESALPLVSRYHNLIILKSLTKPFGIGGLRSGYAVSSGETLRRIRNLLLPWGVSSIAQKIIPALFAERSAFRMQWKAILDERREMVRQFSLLGYACRSDRCPFFLVNVDDAEGVRKKMLAEHHIALRSCASFGMPAWVRIMPGIPLHNERLLAAFSTIP